MTYSTSDLNAEPDMLRRNSEQDQAQVASDCGARLIACGQNVDEVYHSACTSGVDIPHVVCVEAAEDLPFGGW
jgi:hypothetical protein